MRRTIFIMGIVVLALGMNACKSNKAAESTTPVQTNSNSDLVEKYWKLCEIFGSNLKDEPQLAKDAYITLKAEGNRLVGSNGCNDLSGTYQFGPGNRIKFSQIVSTQKMCINSNGELEKKVNQVLEMADNYYVKGDTLILNRARMAPLARFEVVYLK